MALVTMGIRGGAGGAGSDGLETQDAAYFTRLDGTYSHMLRRSRTRCALLTPLPTMCLVGFWFIYALCVWWQHNTTDAACLIGQSLLRDEKEPELAKLLHDRSTGQDYYYHPYLAPTGLSQWRPQVANTSHDTC